MCDRPKQYSKSVHIKARSTTACRAVNELGSQLTQNILLTILKMFSICSCDMRTFAYHSGNILYQGILYTCSKYASSEQLSRFALIKGTFA